MLVHKTFSSFKNLKLSSKQMLGFGIILFIMAVSHVYSTRNMAALNSEIDQVTSNWLPRAIAISDINVNTSNLRLSQLQQAYTSQEEKKQEHAIYMVELISQIEENLDAYESLKRDSEGRNLYSNEELRLFSAFDEKWETYQDLSLTFFKLIRQNKNQQAVELLNGEARNVFNDLGAALVSLVEVNQKDSFEAAKRAEKMYRTNHKFMITLYIITLVLSVLIALGLVRFITVPVQLLVQAAGKIAEGDLSVKLDVASKDEIGNLAASFNQMTTSLRQAKRKSEDQATKLRAQNKELASAMRKLKETQEQLLLKEKMAALGDLIAGVAHEINNPVGVVNSSVDVSLRCLQKIDMIFKNNNAFDEIKKSGPLPETLKILDENIRTTLTAGERIATIVKSLKNFARLDEAEYQQADLHEGIESTLTLLGSEIRDRISVNKQFGKIPPIFCNPGQLNQVFLNLLRNAAQAIETAGLICIKTYVQDSCIHIEISDNGRGIAQEKIKNIFDFGFSTAGSRVKMTSGLSTAFNIVQKHNGEIFVESEKGKGTTVVVILPTK